MTSSAAQHGLKCQLLHLISIVCGWRIKLNAYLIKSLKLFHRQHFHFHDGNFLANVIFIAKSQVLIKKYKKSNCGIWDGKKRESFDL